MSTRYRNDPAWQQAQSVYIEPDPRLSVDDRLIVRIAAAERMQQIEQAYAHRSR